MISFIADLHPALNEGVVIVEEELGDVPEHTSMQQLVLEPTVHCKRSHCLHGNAVQTSQVLEGGTMPLMIVVMCVDFTSHWHFSDIIMTSYTHLQQTDV